MRRFQKIIALILSLSFLLSLLTGCAGTTNNGNTDNSSNQQSDAGNETPSDGSGTRSVTLSDGYVVEGIPENVERVAALFGPSYEKVYVLGAEDKIAVCSSSHRNNWPWSHLVYQHVDDEDMVVIENASSGLNVEDLLEYDIDVCFYWSTADVLKALENIGIAAVPYSSAGGIDSTKEDLYAYAQVLGGDEAMAIAEKYAAYFDETLAEIEAVTSQIPEEEKKVVYYSRSDILTTYGQDNDIIAMVEAAGGIPASAELATAESVSIDKEQLIDWNPDAIFIDHTGDPQAVVDSVLADSDFTNLSAVQNDAVYSVPTGVFYWDAGVQMILLIKWMAVTLYPEYFPDVDMVAELQDFYQEFYRYDLTTEQAQAILNCENPS